MRGLRGLIVATAVAATLVGCGDDGSSESKTTTRTTAKEKSTTTKTTTTTTTETTTETIPALNITDIETRIAAQLTKPTGSQPPDVVDAVVTCPQDAEGGAGESFDCDVTATTGTKAPQPGSPMTGSATVTLTDDAGTKFSLEYELSGGGFDTEGTVTSVP